VYFGVIVERGHMIHIKVTYASGDQRTTPKQEIHPGIVIQKYGIEKQK
jgi:hypothetical protein